MSEPIIIQASLLEHSQNLTAGDGEMRVKFVVTDLTKWPVFKLFRLVNKSLVVGVTSEHAPLSDFSFRATIPPVKSALGGFAGFAVWFDVPLIDMTLAAKFYGAKALRETVTFELAITEGDELPAAKPKREKKAPEPKGEYGKAWRVIWAKGLFNIPSIRQGLNLPEGEKAIKQRIYDQFNVTSCTMITPSDLWAWMAGEVTWFNVFQEQNARDIYNAAQEAQNNG